jgi:DNA-binding transcriptional LysR family regulator
MRLDTSVQGITNINLKLLQGFVLVAEQYSFRRAAAITGHSQSAVSAQIKRLEEQLGVVLFRRTTRRVELTGEGEQLLSHIRRALNEVEHGLQLIREAVNVKRGRIALSCSPTIASRCLAPILGDFTRAYPRIEIFVSEHSASKLLESIRDRSVDFGIGPTLDDPGFVFEHILEDPLVAVMNQGFFDGYGDKISLTELSRVPLLLLDHTTALRKLVEETAAELKLTLSTRFQFTHAQTLLSMAECGLGVAILPKVALPRQLVAPMRAIPIVKPVLSRRLAIITLRGHVVSPATSRLLPFFRRMGTP